MTALGASVLGSNPPCLLVDTYNSAANASITEFGARQEIPPGDLRVPAMIWRCALPLRDAVLFFVPSNGILAISYLATMAVHNLQVPTSWH